MNLGYGDFVGNENFGPSTERALKAFQADNNLVVNGIGDPVTLRKLEELETPSVLKRGDNNPAVKELKLDLARLGFVVSNNPNNIFGPTTEKTVKEFQSYYGISPDGVVGSETFRLIESILNSPLQRGRSSPEAVDLKNSLMNLGYGDFVGNENFGPSTERALKALQADNNLVVNGIGDPVTLRKLEELETPSVLKRGDNNPAVKELKLDLARLGFVVSNNPNNIFGPTTEKTVKEFQSYYGISPDGVVGSKNLKKIMSIIKSPLQRRRRNAEALDIKNSLMNLGYGDFVGKENFGPSTERALKKFQKDNGLVVNGIGDPVTLKKINQLLEQGEGLIEYTHYNISLSQAVNIQMTRSPQTDKKEYAWVSKSYIDINNKVTATTLNVRPDPNTTRKAIGTLSKGTKVDIIDQKGNWYAIKYNNSSWVHAVREDVRYYLNPNNFINDNRQKFQFLDLSKPSGASRSVLNNYLKGRDVLANQGQAFIDAARTHGVNDIYLISHSVLETGHGTSTLAKGVEVGVNKDGKPVLVTKSNRKSLKNIKTVYNMYGIGAVDSNPLGGGAIRAYNEGWDTVDKAIIGGAKFIGNSYIKNGQNTLYKMRWNPKMNEGMAWKQYATDIGWASKQVHTMYNLYQEIGHNNPILDIPVYK